MTQEVDMQVEELQNYGKDLITIQSTSRVPLYKKLALLPYFLSFFSALLNTLGLRGVFRMVREARQEYGKWRLHDWSYLRKRGLSAKNLDAILKKMTLAKVMADSLGLRKAAHLRHRLSARIAYPILEQVFAPPRVFLECGGGDFLPPFKQYFVALMEAMDREGLEAAEVVEDTPDVFQINVTYCAWAEVAKVIGNPRYCYYATCYGDEVFFPRLCEAVGFKFERTGTLGQEEPYCDYRFTRIMN